MEENHLIKLTFMLIISIGIYHIANIISLPDIISCIL